MALTMQSLATLVETSTAEERKTLVNHLTPISKPQTVSRQLDLLCWNNGLPFDVKCLINRYLRRGILRGAMLEITDPKMHRDIRRMLKYDGYSVSDININYGRLMLHCIRPTTFENYFYEVDYDHYPNVVGVRMEHRPKFTEVYNGVLEIVPRSGMEYHDTCSKETLVTAIMENTYKRYLKEYLLSMDKDKLFNILKTLPELSIEYETKRGRWWPKGVAERKEKRKAKRKARKD